MRYRVIFIFSTILLIAVAAVHCKDEHLAKQDDVQLNGNVLTLTARIPGIDTSLDVASAVRPRLSAIQKDLNVLFRWEEGDQLELCIVYDGKKEKQVADLINISEGGSSAQFEVCLPEGDYTEFDLYGVYGGGGLSEDDYTKVTLPTSIASTGSLEDMADVMVLAFAAREVNKINPLPSVELRQVGSLFSIQVKNSAEATVENIKEVQLVSSTPVAAHHISLPAYYDLATEEFSGTTSNATVFPLPLETPVALSEYEILSIWKWFVPVQGKEWPAMRLQLIDDNNGTIAITRSAKPARTAPIPTGKAFYLYADWDGSSLDFSNVMYENSVTFRTTKAAGSTITLRIDAATEDRDEVWIDLNNNGVRDQNEDVVNFGSGTAANTNYRIESDIITIYGDITVLYAQQQEITSIDFSNSHENLEIISLATNQIEKVELSRLKGLESFTIRGNKLSELDLSHNSALREVYAENNQLTSLLLPEPPSINAAGRPALITVRVHTNKLDSVEISSIITSLPDRSGDAQEGRFDLWNTIEQDDNAIARDHFKMAIEKNFFIREYFASGQHPRVMHPGETEEDILARREALTGIQGTFNSVPRLANGRADLFTLVTQLRDLNVDTYFWWIWHSQYDWDDLHLFLPLAKEHNIKVWVGFPSPDQVPPRRPEAAPLIPFGLDYKKWIAEIAKLSIEYPNIVAYSFDDFYGWSIANLWTPAYMNELKVIAHAYNPKLGFVPCVYYNRSKSSGFLDSYEEFFDAILFPYKAESSGEQNLRDTKYFKDEIAEMRTLVTNKDIPFILDIYSMGHSRIDHPSTAAYVGEMIELGKQYADGVMIYTHPDVRRSAYTEKYYAVKHGFSKE